MQTEELQTHLNMLVENILTTTNDTHLAISGPSMVATAVAIKPAKLWCFINRIIFTENSHSKLFLIVYKLDKL